MRELALKSIGSHIPREGGTGCRPTIHPLEEYSHIHNIRGRVIHLIISLLRNEGSIKDAKKAVEYLPNPDFMATFLMLLRNECEMNLRKLHSKNGVLPLHAHSIEINPEAKVEIFNSPLMALLEVAFEEYLEELVNFEPNEEERIADSSAQSAKSLSLQDYIVDRIEELKIKGIEPIDGHYYRVYYQDFDMANQETPMSKEFFDSAIGPLPTMDEEEWMTWSSSGGLNKVKRRLITGEPYILDRIDLKFDEDRLTFSVVLNTKKEVNDQSEKMVLHYNLLENRYTLEDQNGLASIGPYEAQRKLGKILAALPGAQRDEVMNHIFLGSAVKAALGEIIEKTIERTGQKLRDQAAVANKFSILNAVRNTTVALMLIMRQNPDEVAKRSVIDNQPAAVISRK